MAPVISLRSDLSSLLTTAPQPGIYTPQPKRNSKLVALPAIFSYTGGIPNKEVIYMTFGENLQFLRKRAGMTQEELAEKMEVSRQSVSKV